MTISATETAVQTKHEFTITAGNEEAAVLGRSEAVQQAKEMSGKTWRPVYVVRADRRVSMRFGRGVLIEYGFETHSQRGSRD